MYACHTCDRSERYARRCPKRPLEWTALERQGVAFEGGTPERIAKGLQAQMDAHPGWAPELRGRVTEEYEELMGRVYAERDYGPFGEDHPDYPVCDWYLLDAGNPWVGLTLQRVRLDSNYGLVTPAGDLDDHDAYLADAVDVIRAVNGEIDRERVKSPRAGEGAGNG